MLRVIVNAVALRPAWACISGEALQLSDLFGGDAMGRPTDYGPAYCDRVIELGKQGASVAEMAFELDTTKQTLHNWAGAHPDFLDAFTRAKLASQVWWERKGRSGMEKSSSEFQASVWSRSMAARFPEDWREVKGTELTGKDGAPVETIARIERVILDPSDSNAA